MSRGHSKHVSYYLICDPATGLVVRRDHTSAKLQEMHLVSVYVDKAVWGTYKAGDVVSSADLEPAQAAKWLKARTRYVTRVHA